MKTKPCVTCGTLKRIDLMVKNNDALKCVSCYTGKLLTHKEKKQ